MELRVRMKWRVVMEVTDANGTVRAHEIGGGAPVDDYLPGPSV
jgi:hypothetical protein